MTPIVVSARSSSAVASPALMMSVSIAVRPSTDIASSSASFAFAKLTTSLNDPPDANWAVPSAMSG